MLIMTDRVYLLLLELSILIQLRRSIFLTFCRGKFCFFSLGFIRTKYALIIYRVREMPANSSFLGAHSA